MTATAIRTVIDGDVTTKVANLRVQDSGAPATPQACLMMLSGPLLGEIYPLLSGPLVLGRSEHADVQILVEGVSRQHARLLRDRGGWVVEDLGSRNGTLVNSEPVHRTLLRDGDKIQVGPSTVFKFALQDPIEEQFQRQMYESALRDGLTKVFNKRYFIERLRSEVAYALRHHCPLSLLMLDVDHFKQVNDGHGHPVGDMALQIIADSVRGTMRSEDVLARIGGEEFALICRGVPIAGAHVFAERIRQLIAYIAFRDPSTDEPVPLAVSIGVAQLRVQGPWDDGGPEPAETLVAQADLALYTAKDAGRNCVRVAGQPAC